MRNTVYLVALACGIFSSATVAYLPAATVSYTVIKEESSVTLASVIANGAVTMVPQIPGSNLAKLQGNLLVDLTGDVLTFSTGSNIDVAAFEGGTLNPSPLQTGSGALEDNFGYKDHLTGQIVLATVRDMSLDIVSGAATFGGAVTGLSFQFPTGIVDSYSSIANPSEEYGILDMRLLEAFSNQAAGVLQRVVNGSVERITIPIFGVTTYDLFPLDDIDDSSLTLTGQIVAERTLPTPEPSGFFIMLWATAGFASVRRHALSARVSRSIK